MSSRKYNQRYYKKNRKKMIQEERLRRVQRRKIREEKGERLRQGYKTAAKNKHGHSICEHSIEQYRCKQCFGGGVCEHLIRRTNCQFCNPLSWAKRILRDQQKHAANKNHKSPIITPEELVILRQKSEICVLCEEFLIEKPVLHHNHQTGEVIGFAHGLCNSIEGFLSKLSETARARFLKNVFSI